MALSRITGKWIRVLLHGRSSDRSDVKESVEVTRQSGHHVEVRVSWEPGDMRRLACEAVEDGVEILVAGGGDGTINEVVCGLFEATDLVRDRPSLGILPLGTVNAFARSCEIPFDPRSAFELVCSAKSSPIDVVRSRNRVVVNIASWGIGTAFDLAAGPDAGKRPSFNNCWTRRGLHEPQPVSVIGPELGWTGTCLLLVLGNGRQVAEGWVPCPNALLDDGLIDLILLPENLGEGVASLERALRLEGPVAIEERAIQARVPWVEIKFEEEQEVRFDGEPEIQDHFHFEVDSKSVRVHLPEGTPLLRQPHQRVVEIKSFRHYSRKPSGNW